MENKNFEDLVNYHWDVFLSFVLRYHPIRPSIIDTYSAEINWYALSGNKTDSWTKELLKKIRKQMEL